jgi:ATP-dependent DNA helicase RecQ
MITSQILHDSLKENFGFNSELIRRKIIYTMPYATGGKSICFQLPALLFSGITIVISPLIALMKDQVDSLKANGIEACFINSSQTSAEQQVHIENLKNKSRWSM